MWAPLNILASREMKLERQRWKPPAAGHFVLNCDASVAQFGSLAGYGGLIRDFAGSLLCSFQAKRGGGSVLYAELRAILLGLKFAWSAFRLIRVDSDSREAINLLDGRCDLGHPQHQLVEEIHRFSGQYENEVWNHVVREANSVVDEMAKQALKMSFGFEEHEIAPDCILQALILISVPILPSRES
ncbi:hypothetical protein JHK82_049082 [Glycine max]|nr:hypothetical protein JHK86_048941 [Glycine max]KAG5090304.1 hypothetical protein JHK82_049082 [Glycine max]